MGVPKKYTAIDKADWRHASALRTVSKLMVTFDLFDQLLTRIAALNVFFDHREQSFARTRFLPQRTRIKEYVVKQKVPRVAVRERIGVEITGWV
jgi:hypothetical protein